MKIFITGIAGFLGSHLADHFLNEGHTVIGVDNLIGGYYSNIPIKAKCFLLDMVIIQPEQLAKKMKDCDVVYHCAAAPYEGVSSFSPSYICSNIFSGSVNVFTAAIIAKVKRIVFCSSMARYGSGGEPFLEYYIPRPVDPYGISKVAAEQVLRNLSETHGFEYVIAVPHNIYGPRQKYDDPYRNVASIMSNRMLQGKQPIIYGDGKQKRCFSYISDCVSCLGKMATQSNLHGEIINIGPDEGTITINELAEKIANLTGMNLEPIYMPDRPREVKYASCSSDKARGLLKYETKIFIDEGLQYLVNWIRENGVKPFSYKHVDLEIINEKTPKTWKNRLI